MTSPPPETASTPATADSPSSPGDQHGTADTQQAQQAASSHEAPRSYYPTNTDRQNRGTPHVATTPAQQNQQPPHPLQDGRTLRRGQPDKLPEQQPQPSQHKPAATSLAELLSDGRNIGRRHRREPGGGNPPTPTPTPPAWTPPQPTPGPAGPTQQDDDPSSLVQTHMTQSHSGGKAPNKQPQQPHNSIDNTLEQTPTTPNPTPPSEIDDAELAPSLPAEQHTLHPNPPLGEQASSSTAPPPRQRSWERVQRHLNEIRSLAEAFDNSQGEAIARTAEIALVDLLVDTPTAEALDQMGDGLPPPATAPPAAAAKYAAQQLCNIGRSQLALGGNRCINYAMVAPHVAALLRWLETLQMGDVAVHIQLPPVLSPLREVLNVILEGGTMDTNLWARLVAVGEALCDLVSGNTLAHPADVLLQAGGGVESALVQNRDMIPEWYRAVEILRGMLREVSTWPENMLPTMQQAALNLVHAISALIPEEKRGGEGDWQPVDWWRTERHHGLGDVARSQAPPSPRSRGTRRARSPSTNRSDASHRRRRALAEHVHDHDL